MVQNQKSVYEKLGVKRIINAKGCVTTLGGSLMKPEVLDALADASRHHVHLNELLTKASNRIAELTGAEAAFISSGAAACLLLTAAACLTGKNESAVLKLPSLSTERNEFLDSIVDEHTYIHQAFRTSGGKVIIVGDENNVSVEDYANAINSNTAALLFFYGEQSKAQLAEVVELGKKEGIPVIVDAASQLPPKSNLYDLIEIGADLVVFSGGKGIGGPQCSGIILGRKDLVDACVMNASPNSAIGRALKVGKEEIVGLVTALENFVETDEDQLLNEWLNRANTILQSADGISKIGTEIKYYPKGGAHTPVEPVAIISLLDLENAAERIQEKLVSGDPSIEIDIEENSLVIGTMSLKTGDAEIIAEKLSEAYKML